MILLPIGTDAPRRMTPTVNYALITINAVAFILFNLLAQSGGSRLMVMREHLTLWPGSPELFQFLTYQFLHAGWLHILGNMWFLYLFGNPVNGKMGNVPYLFFYLAGGVFAGLGFAVTGSQNPIVGASGAIAAVTTAYLVLYPRSTIRLFYWFFVFIGDIEVGSILMIAGKMIVWDNIISANVQTGGVPSNIAYEAHLAGYAFGFAATLFMLVTRALPRDPFDILAVWSRYRRRREFVSVFAQPQFSGPAAEPVQKGGGWALPRARPVSGSSSSEIDKLREQISRAVDRFELPEAVTLYRQLIEKEPGQVLSRSNQLDVANQLTADGDFPLAAQAYERFLERYSSGTTADHVRFLLGVIYSRHLKEYAKAVHYLQLCRPQLSDKGMIEQCDYWLQVAKAHDQPASNPKD